MEINNMSHKLYDASMRGCVATLNKLIQNDPFILHKVSLNSFTETPLHISALLGHIEFTKALLSRKPELANELDSFKRSPLHLASAEGHKDIVRELLKANMNACFVADQEGRIPLHLAAMRGRIEVIQELIMANRESLRKPLLGDTVLHLCVRYNHLDALKLLVELVKDPEFLNKKDHQGNTILQVSAMLKQLETTRYLLTVPQIRVDVNSFIENGFAAFDARRNGAIQSNLQQPAVGGKTLNNIPSTQLPKTRKVTPQKQPQPAAQSSYNWKKLLKCQSDWYEKRRGNLMVVATLIAAMSFQIATNPPGGYWQSDTTDQGCPKGITCIAGTPIRAYTDKRDYRIYIIFSTLSFSSSLIIILLLVSGVPLENIFFIGIFVLGFWATILFLAAAYYFSISLVQLPEDKTFLLITYYYPKVFIVLIGAIVSILVLRFCWGLLKKLFIGLIYLVTFCVYLPSKKKQQLVHAVVVV